MVYIFCSQKPVVFEETAGLQPTTLRWEKNARKSHRARFFPMITIHRADPSDSQAIRNLEKETHGEEVTSRYDIAPLVLFGYAYVAKKQGKVVGAITAWQTAKGEVNINDWVVNAAYRRQGIGEKLYLQLIQETKGKIILSLVDIKNAASMKAHEKLGFKAVQKMQDAYQLGRGDEQVLWKLENK